jgi:hypothetical protein
LQQYLPEVDIPQQLQRCADSLAKRVNASGNAGGRASCSIAC